MAQSIPRVVADFETSLASSVAQGDTTASLLSNLDTNSVALAAGYYGLTVDNGSDYKEFILCSVSGTALTNVYSVSDQGTATVGFANYHRRGAPVQITDHASLLKVVQTLTAQIGIDGGNPLYYDSTPALVSGLQLATVQYVLDTVNGGAVTFNAEVIAGMAGETLTTGQWVYLKTSDGRWYKTDATDTTKCLGVRVGKALGAGTAGNAITGGVFVNGLETSGTYSAFTTYYLSNTPGAVATSPGTNSVVVGVSDGNSKLISGQIAPSYRDALAGTSGTPNSTNQYLTALSVSNASSDQSQTTQNGTFSAGEANATTRHNKLAQSFLPTKTQLKSVSLYKSANTGTFTGTVTVSIQADSAGSPSGSDLVSKTITNALYNAYSVGEFLVLFSSEITITPNSLYWIVISTSTSDTANCINLGTNTAGGYTNGSAKYNNTTDGWVAIATIDLYFKTGQGTVGKEVSGIASTGQVAGVLTKPSIKIGTVTLTNATTPSVAHGLGKVPTYIEFDALTGSSSQIDVSNGTYDVGAGTYATAYAYYNEASAGAGGVDTTTILVGTSNTRFATIAAVDENVVIFGLVTPNVASSFPGVYRIIG